MLSGDSARQAYLALACDDLECLHDLLGSSPTSHIKEVGRLTSVQLNNVHGRHGKTSAVH